MLNIDNIVDKTTFIIGHDKNVGKTTYFKYLVNQVRDKSAPTYLTIGVDGESADLIAGTSKPQIFAQKGDFVVTTEAMLANTDVSYKVHEVYRVKTAMGFLMLIEVLRGGAIELIGPEHNVQLQNVLKHLGTLGLNTIIVDGAIDRVTQVSASKTAGFIYVLKIDATELHLAIDKMKIIHLLKNILMISEEDMKDDSVFYMSGAFTKSKLQLVPDGTTTIVVDDFTKLFLQLRDLRMVLKKYEIRFKYKFEFLHYIVNLYNFEKAEFIKQLNNKEIEDFVIYNPFKTDVN
ncbi:MAG: hypothetical protein HRT71_16095 [Flavobacteriales bacterium]|nr:hypothetical protein [Flavobacteriales bacterium]